MMLDTIEKKGLDSNVFDINEKLKSLNKSFESSIKPENSAFIAADNVALDMDLSELIGIACMETITANRSSIFHTVKAMYQGIEINGKRTLGLEELSQWRKNPEYYNSNVSQHSGYAAEIITVAQENVNAQVNGTGVVSYRYDDYSGIKNDPYIDIIRKYPDGTTETVQMKYVGNSPKECFKLLKSKKYEKYLDKVDKINIPEDYYDAIRDNNWITEEISKKQIKLDELLSNGETEKAAKVAHEIDKLKTIDEKLERGSLTKNEAENIIETRNNAGRFYSQTRINGAHKAGIEGAKNTALLTLAVSSGENIFKYAKGDISGTEAIETIFRDTAISGGMGYCLNFISAFTGSNVPAAAITMGISSYSDIKDFASGDISGSELAYNLGENVFRIAGGIVGATAGSPLGILGMAGGGIVGSEAAAQLYKVGVDYVSDHFEVIKEKASDFKDMAIDFKDTAGDKLDDLKDTATDKLENLKDEATDKMDSLKESAVNELGDLKDVGGDRIDDLKDSAADKLESAKSGAVKLLKKIR